jgi:uncharacterized membrane protein
VADAARVRAWCFWCLASSAINMAILALSVAGAREASSMSRQRHETPLP